MIEVESTKRSDSPHGLVAKIIYDEDTSRVLPHASGMGMSGRSSPTPAATPARWTTRST